MLGKQGGTEDIVTGQGIRALSQALASPNEEEKGTRLASLGASQMNAFSIATGGVGKGQNPPKPHQKLTHHIN